MLLGFDSRHCLIVDAVHATRSARQLLGPPCQRVERCKIGRDLVRVAVYQSITFGRRMIRVGSLMHGL